MISELEGSLQTIRSLSPEIFFSCVCGAHWLTNQCDPKICHTTHIPVLCNWPPNMLKYYSVDNYRAYTQPVDIPIPLVTAMVRVDFKTKTVWLDTLPEWEARKLATLNP